MCDHVMKKIVDVVAHGLHFIVIVVAVVAADSIAFILVWCGKDSIARSTSIVLVFLFPLEIALADSEYLPFILVVKKHALVFFKELELV